jgi:hypothetical protein
MSSPVQLNIVITQNNAGTVTSPTIVVPIPAALQALDSTTPGSVQQGYSAVDIAIRNIFRAGCFTDGQGNWFSVATIQKITAQ